MALKDLVAQAQGWKAAAVEKGSELVRFKEKKMKQARAFALEHERGIHTAETLAGTVVGAPFAAWLTQRYISPAHDNLVAGIGLAASAVLGVVAFMEPKYAGPALGAAALTSGPATYVAGKLGAQAQVNAQQAAGGAPGGAPMAPSS